MSTLSNSMQDAVNSYESALSFNLRNVVRHFLWKLCLENDNNPNYGPNRNNTKEFVYMAGDLDEIIRIVIKTSEYTNREDGENYPIWDESKVSEAMERVMKVLIKAGVAEK